MQRKLTAILSADVKGYSRLMGQDEEATVEALLHFRALIASRIESHGGRVVDAPIRRQLIRLIKTIEALDSLQQIWNESEKCDAH